MNEDILYPVSSEKLIKRPESVEKRQSEKEMAYLKERPILNEILEYLDNEIETYKSVESVRTEDVNEFRFDVEVNKRMIKVLNHERSAIERLARMFEK